MLAEAGRPEPPGQRIMSLLETFMRGERVTEQHVAGALNDVAAWAMGGGVAGGYYPSVGGPARHEDFRPPPPPDPVDAETRRARARARQVLGFTVGQVLTVDQISDRRKTLSKRTHPDLFPEGPRRKAAEERMIRINQAVNTLLEELGENGSR